MSENIPMGEFPGKISGKFREIPGNFPTRKFPGKISGKFREISGKVQGGKFPGKLSGKIRGKFIFSSAEFDKIPEIVQTRFAASC